MGAWLRVVAGLVLAVGMTQWPYGHACGFGLAAYLLAVAGVLGAGAWAGVYAWKARLALAHLAALAVTLWGLGLAAAQILPRVGYARAEASWVCRQAVRTPVVGPAEPSSAVVEPASPQDSLAPPDTVSPPDSATAGEVPPPDRSEGR